jgi:hypothetical protein
MFPERFWNVPYLGVCMCGSGGGGGGGGGDAVLAAQRC